MQLVDAVSGAHLWAENYERTFSPEAVFELQDDLVPRIVSMVAGMNGVLPQSMSETVRSRAPEQLSPYEAVLRSFGYLERVTPEEHRHGAVRPGTGGGARRPIMPMPGRCWRCCASRTYAQRVQPSGLIPWRAGSDAARRAVEAAPSNHLASFSLAQALLLPEGDSRLPERGGAGCRTQSRWTASSIAFLGELLTYAGDSERGCALAARAKQLNPNHPGWYWYADFYDAYRQGDDRGALEFALKINLPGHWCSHVATAAACGQLGERDAAEKALRELLELRPDFAATARERHGEVVGAASTWSAYRRAAQGGTGRSPRRRQTGTVKPETTVARAEDGSGSRCCRFPTVSADEGPGVPLRGHGRGDHERARLADRR